MPRTPFALLLAAVSLPLAAADTYEIDPTHTFAYFEYSHLGFSRPVNSFNKVEGAITLDLAQKSGTADITIPVNSVETGVKKFNDHLKSKDFFEADKHPNITFKSNDFKFEGNKLVAVNGNLTVHGVTKPVTLKVTEFNCKEHPMKKVQACGATATADIKRSDFGVGAYAPAVSDETQLRITIEAMKK